MKMTACRLVLPGGATMSASAPSAREALSPLIWLSRGSAAKPAFSGPEARQAPGNKGQSTRGTSFSSEWYARIDGRRRDRAWPRKWCNGPGYLAAGGQSAAADRQHPVAQAAAEPASL